MSVDPIETRAESDAVGDRPSARRIGVRADSNVPDGRVAGDGDDDSDDGGGRDSPGGSARAAAGPDGNASEGNVLEGIPATSIDSSRLAVGGGIGR